MEILALLVAAALAFTVLAGVIEIRGARARRRLLERTSPVLHPLAQHPLPRTRHFSSRRALRHVGLFVGFLVVVYVGTVLLRALYSLLAQWF